MKNQHEINHIFRMAVMHPAPSPAPNSVALGKWRILEVGPLDWCWEPPPGSFAEWALKKSDMTIPSVIGFLTQEPFSAQITHRGDYHTVSQSRQQLKCLLYNMLAEKIHQGKRKDESYLINQVDTEESKEVNREEITKILLTPEPKTPHLHRKTHICENLTELNLPSNHPQPNEKPQEYDFGDKVSHQPEISLNDKRSVPTWTSTSSDGSELAIKRLNTYLDQAISLFQLHQNIRWDKNAAPTCPHNKTHIMDHPFPSIWTSGDKERELFFAVLHINNSHGWAGLMFPYDGGRGLSVGKDKVRELLADRTLPPPISRITSKKTQGLTGQLLYWENVGYKAWSESYPDREKIVIHDETGWSGREVTEGGFSQLDMPEMQIFNFLSRHLIMQDFLHRDWGDNLEMDSNSRHSTAWIATCQDGTRKTLRYNHDHNTWSNMISTPDRVVIGEMNQQEVDFFRLCHGIKYDQGVYNRE